MGQVIKRAKPGSAEGERRYRRVMDYAFTFAYRDYAACKDIAGAYVRGEIDCRDAKNAVLRGCIDALERQECTDS